MQSWRVIGVMFLAFYAFGLLPGLFAWPAGVGDAIVGFSAPFVLRAMVRAEPTWRRRVIWLNVGGLVDFAVALAPRASLGALPLSLIPTFAVPLWTIFHVISLVQLHRTESRQQNFTICTHALDTARASS